MYSILKRTVKNFWKLLKAKSHKQNHNTFVVAGCSEPSQIADNFRKYCSGIYVDSASDQAAVNEFLATALEFSLNSRPNISDYLCDIETVEKCLNELKCRKAAGHECP